MGNRERSPKSFWIYFCRWEYHTMVPVHAKAFWINQGCSPGWTPLLHVPVAIIPPTQLIIESVQGAKGCDFHYHRGLLVWLWSKLINLLCSPPDRPRIPRIRCECDSQGLRVKLSQVLGETACRNACLEDTHPSFIGILGSLFASQFLLSSNFYGRCVPCGAKGKKEKDLLYLGINLI